MSMEEEETADALECGRLVRTIKWPMLDCRMVTGQIPLFIRLPHSTPT